MFFQLFNVSIVDFVAEHENFLRKVSLVVVTGYISKVSEVCERITLRRFKWECIRTIFAAALIIFRSTRSCIAFAVKCAAFHDDKVTRAQNALILINGSACWCCWWWMKSAKDTMTSRSNCWTKCRVIWWWIVFVIDLWRIKVGFVTLVDVMMLMMLKWIRLELRWDEWHEARIVCWWNVTRFLIGNCEYQKKIVQSFEMFQSRWSCSLSSWRDCTRRETFANIGESQHKNNIIKVTRFKFHFEDWFWSESDLKCFDFCLHHVKDLIESANMSNGEKRWKKSTEIVLAWGNCRNLLFEFEISFRSTNSNELWWMQYEDFNKRLTNSKNTFETSQFLCKFFKRERRDEDGKVAKFHNSRISRCGVLNSAGNPFDPQMIWLISHTDPNNLTEFCIDPKHKMSHNILIFSHYSLHSYATRTRQHRRLRRLCTSKQQRWSYRNNVKFNNFEMRLEQQTRLPKTMNCKPIERTTNCRHTEYTRKTNNR